MASINNIQKKKDNKRNEIVIADSKFRNNFNNVIKTFFYKWNEIYRNLGEWFLYSTESSIEWLSQAEKSVYNSTVIIIYRLPRCVTLGSHSSINFYFNNDAVNLSVYLSPTNALLSDNSLKQYGNVGCDILARIYTFFDVGVVVINGWNSGANP